MKMSCATAFLLSVLAVPEPGRGQDLDLELLKGTKECVCVPAAHCEIVIRGIKALDADISGGIGELAEVDGEYLGLIPHDPAAPFGLSVEFRLAPCATLTRPLFLRAVTRAEPPLTMTITLKNRITGRYDDIQELKMFLEENDYATWVGDLSEYVADDGTIELTLRFRFPPLDAAGLELRGTNRIGIDLDKIEIFE